MTGQARVGVLLAVLAGTAACDVHPDYLKESNRRARLASVGVERFDSAGRFSMAGLSTHREIDIDPIDPDEIGVDSLDPAYHVYHMRCGSCHEVPSPSTKPGYMWEASMSRMRRNAAEAGLMPMSSEDEATVLEFLKKHASDGPDRRR